MPQRITINSEKAKINLDIFTVIFGVATALFVAIAIYSLNSQGSQTSYNQSTNTANRTLDQSTINNINKLTGSAQSLPTTRNNPFSE